MNNRTLIIFAREPQKGKVKTRLRRQLSLEECLALYKTFLRATVALGRKITCERKVIVYESSGEEPVFLKKIAADFEFYEQRGNDLGERMCDAFESFLKEEAKVVMFGSDTPDLPETYLRAAFARLASNDLVVGPADDGGYYLIGLKAPCREIFKDIPWSTDAVFDLTLQKARKAGKQIAVLEQWHDIDLPQDLKHLEAGKYVDQSLGGQNE